LFIGLKLLQTLQLKLQLKRLQTVTMSVLVVEIYRIVLDVKEEKYCKDQNVFKNVIQGTGDLERVNFIVSNVEMIALNVQAWKIVNYVKYQNYLKTVNALTYVV